MLDAVFILDLAAVEQSFTGVGKEQEEPDSSAVDQEEDPGEDRVGLYHATVADDGANEADSKV